MADAKGVVLALAAARKGSEAILLTQTFHALAAPGEDFVRIGLMTDIPDQAVFRRVVDIMQGNGQLDHAKASTEVPAGPAHAVEEVLTQFVGEFFEFRFA